ncbi:MAG: bifunctional folylpolyglutamate synthase/dihydrofolate synthase [Planctomycetota bacterium]|nr:bifunctional folylpolyglutamate synthase/dihydrofolate synthase [Planctomycetota bacterium]MDA1213234.1 bifunctional folylpolyglutamate synthase/dihydrofolate synthase [Planctomycetota bacterium]
MTRRFTTYDQAVEFLFGRINYERPQLNALKASDFKLDRMRLLLERLGNPQNDIPAIHIAGTKGKGSTAVMISEILQAAGFRVGLFTSPHLAQFEERMRVDGRMPNSDEVLDILNTVADVVTEMDADGAKTPVTFFEMTTAMAWLFYRQQNVEIVSLEVGLGGRLDSTNICQPEICLITNISRDHVAILGNTVEKIAREKAGIIKPGVPVICGVTTPGPRAVINEVAIANTSEVWQRDRDIFATYECTGNCELSLELAGCVDVETPVRYWKQIPVTLPGAHQGNNAALAVATVDRLNQRGWSISDEAVYGGMQRVRWPARIEILHRRPWVILDAAHNEASCAALLETLNARFPGGRKIIVFAVSKDKDVQGLLQQLVGYADKMIFTQYLSNPRAMPTTELISLAESLKPGTYRHAASPQQAWQMAEQLIGPNDVICITGSFFLAAEFREIWRQRSLELSVQLVNA